MLIALVCFVTFSGAICTIKYAPGEVSYRKVTGSHEIIVFKILSLLLLILWNGLTMYFIKLNQSIILAGAFGLITQVFSFTPWGSRAITCTCHE
ncbi:MAG: accessory gene regulator B family protein [Desulfotomaculales bacterium]